MEEKFMKKILIGFAMIALLLCFTTSPASAQAKGKCVGVYLDWTGVGNYEGPYHFWFDADGTFTNEFSSSGVWYESKGAKVWIFNASPHAFYSGKKTSGYMRTDATVWGGLPGIWYSKGAKKTECNFILSNTVTDGGVDPTNPSE
jgi:hypothetical protein